MPETKWKLADTSQWPVISQEKYLDILTALTASLLASGHYTQPCDLSEEDAGSQALLRQKSYFGFYESCAIEAAETLAREVVKFSGMQLPELPEVYEEKEEPESSS